MIKKINMAIVKEYGIKHGEKIALGTCAFIALFLGLLGFWRALSSGHMDGSSKLWAQELREQQIRIETAIANVPPKDLDPAQKKMIEKDYDWRTLLLPHDPQKYEHIGERPGGDLRTNPMVLPVRPDDLKNSKTYIQLDYIRACGLYYQNSGETRWELKPAGVAVGKLPNQPPAAGATGMMPILAKDARPSRMIFGTAIFPMKEQVEIFRKALRMTSQKELFDSPEHLDLPRPLGFNLKRYEIGSDGKPVNPVGEWIIGYDKGKFKVSSGVKRMLRDAVYDEQMAIYLEKYIFAGLTMPIPKLGNAHYPKPSFDEVQIARWYEDDEVRPGDNGAVVMQPPPKIPFVPGKGKIPRPMPMPMPMQPMGNDPKILTDMERVALKKKDLEAANLPMAIRLFSRDWEKPNWDRELVNPYHVLGYFPPERKDQNQQPPQMVGPAADFLRYFIPWMIEPPGTVKPGEAPPLVKPNAFGQPGEQQFPDWDRDALVRFIDPDVEPGKTYQYEIQIRMANPNHTKKDKVAFQSLASPAELEPSAWVKSGRITVPTEYFLYAVDQHLLDEWAAGREDKRVPAPKDRDGTTFQIHQWLTKKHDLRQGTDLKIGDMAIAERIFVRRGDPIGQSSEVVVRVWKALKDAFEIPMMLDEAKDKKFKVMKPGVRVDLFESIVRPDGGEEPLPYPVLVDFHGGKRYKAGGLLEDESAVEAMILTPDGKLKILNSRVDSDPKLGGGVNQRAKERQDRVSEVRRRIDTFLGRGGEAPKKGPPVPGGGS